jgi:FKBP-type peptidyl-prolyl cis-trans isomerase
VPTAQFFFNVTDNLKLDSPEYRGTFAVFGWVVEGMETVDAIANVPVGPHPKYADGKSAVVPRVPVIIKSVRPLDVPTEAELHELAGAAFAADDQESIDDVAARVAKEAGRKLVKTDTGLRYVDIVEGEGFSPLETDTIEFNYRGTLTDGTLFESTFDTEPAEREIRALIPGLIEGIMSMKEHGRRKIIIPPELAFGDSGIPGRIPPDSILIFEIELLSVR